MENSNKPFSQQLSGHLPSLLLCKQWQTRKDKNNTKLNNFNNTVILPVLHLEIQSFHNVFSCCRDTLTSCCFDELIKKKLVKLQKMRPENSAQKHMSKNRLTKAGTAWVQMGNTVKQKNRFSDFVVFW